MHALFTDLRLEGRQQLILKSNGSSVSLNASTADVGLPDDVMARDTLILSLLSPLDVPSNLTRASGRGFEVRVREVPCGGLLSVTREGATLPVPPLNRSLDSCLWILKSSRLATSKGLTLLNVSKSGGGGAGDGGELTVRDDGSSRSTRFLNASSTSSFMSSGESLVIEYRLRAGATSAPPLNFSFSLVGESPPVLSCPALTRACACAQDARPCGTEQR